jgi:uncharacterized repeat protein (TIGR01451 family)
MASTFVVPAGAAHAASPVDLFIGVDDRSDPADAYTPVAYSIAVGNRGPGTATAVTVTAQLPPGVSFQSSTLDNRCSATVALLTCDLSTVVPNAVLPFIVELRPTLAGPMSLTFTVSSAERDVHPADNSQTATTDVLPPKADVVLDLGGPGTQQLYAGQPFFFGAGVGNFGPAPATNATAVLRIPAGVSVASNAACVPDGAGSCTFGPMDLPAPGGVLGLLEMLAAAPGTYTISGSATADQPDPDLTNNTGSVTFTVAPAADLSVTIAESADPTRHGQPLSYRVAVTNNGPSPASDVTLTDEWSSTDLRELALLSMSASQGQCALTASARVDCGFGELASGATATLTLQLRGRGVGTVTNHAQATATEYDANTANNAATETTAIR